MSTVTSEREAFDGWVKSLPDTHWAKHDISACRLGWEAAITHLAQPPQNTGVEPDPILFEAVGRVERDATGDLDVNWILEGGIHAVGEGSILLCTDREVTDSEGCAELYLRAERARVPDVVWLIESNISGPTALWWNGLPEGCGKSFTGDPNKAVRFHRKEDAEAVAQHMHMVIVTSHMWLATAPSQPESNS